MKKLILPIAVMLVAIQGEAQEFETKAAAPLAVTKGTVYMKLLFAADGDIYSLKVQDMVKKLNCSYSICRYDKNMTMLYESSLDKLVGDRFFEGVYSTKGRIYLFTADYHDKNRKYTIFGIEIDAKTGNATGAEKVLYTYDLLSNWDKVFTRIVPDADSSRFIITSLSDNKDDPFYYNTVVDLNLGTSFTIKATPRTPESQVFRMEDVILENNNTLILTGKIFDVIREPKGGTSRKFKRYSIQRFDMKGKKILDYTLNLKDKYPINCKLFKLPASSELLLAGTYYDDETKVETKGVFFTKLDNATLASGELSVKEFTNDEKFNRDLDISYPGINSFYFNNFSYNAATKKLFLVAETYALNITKDRYWYDVVTIDADKTISRKNESMNTVSTYTYHCGDMLVVDVNPESKSINRYYLVAKRQVEKIAESEENNYPGILNAFSGNQPDDYMWPLSVAPFYSSYSFHFLNNNFYLFYNEQLKKEVNTKEKDRYPGYYTSTLKCVTINTQSGSITTKTMKANEPQFVFMPRFILPAGKDIYAPAMNVTPKIDASFKLSKFTLRD